MFDNEKEEEDELFSSKPKRTKHFAQPAKAKPSSVLFGDSTEDDLFSTPSKPPTGKSDMTIENGPSIHSIVRLKCSCLPGYHIR